LKLLATLLATRPLPAFGRPLGQWWQSGAPGDRSGPCPRPEPSRWLLATLALALLAGCENLDEQRDKAGLGKGPAFEKAAATEKEFYTPLRGPTHADAVQEVTPAKAEEGFETTFTPTPHVNVTDTVSSVGGDDTPPGLEGPPITVN
jgi:hypothetical protein